MRAAIATLTALFTASGLTIAACAPPKPPKPKPKAAQLEADDDGEVAADDADDERSADDNAEIAAPKPATPVVGAMPPVDAKAAQNLAEVLRHADEGNEARIAAAGLAEIEAERLPAYMIRALKDYGDVTPDHRSMVVSREIGGEAGQAAWNQACAGGVVVFQRVATAAPADKAKLLWKECDLDRLGIFDAEAIASADPAALLLAILAADHLQRADSLSEPEIVAITSLTSSASDD